MRASLPFDQWPIAEEKYQFMPERKVFLLLCDGTEIDSGGDAFDWRPAYR